MKHHLKTRALILPLLVVSLPTIASGGEGINYGQLIAQAVNCLIFFGGLGYILRNVIRDFFSIRVKGIRDDLAMAESSREDAKRRLDEIDEKMANLDREVAGIEAQARKDAEAARERLLRLAEQDAQKIMDQAKADIESSKRDAISQLKAYVADKAISEAEQSVRESITDRERNQLFTDFARQMGARS